MTTTASGREQTTACNGVTTAFPVAFQFIRENADLLVYSHDSATFDPGTATLLTEGTDYTVSGSGRAKTAVVNTLSALPTGAWLTRYRVTSREQSADFVGGSAGLSSQSLEDALDRGALAAEEIEAELLAIPSVDAASQAAVARLSADRATAAASSAAINAATSSLAAAAAQALASGYLFDTSAEGVSQGVTSLSLTVAGTGGTPGEYPLAISGGGGTLATGRIVVAVGGAGSTVHLDNRGKNYTSNPTVSTAAATGLTGATVTAAKGNYAVPDGLCYLVRGVSSLSLWRNVAGVATPLGYTLVGLTDLSTIADNAALTFGRHIDDAALVTLGSLAFTSPTNDPGAGPGYVYLSDPADCDDFVTAIDLNMGGANAGASEIHVYRPGVGPDIVLDSVINVGALAGNHVTLDLSASPIRRRKGWRFGPRVPLYNLLFRIPVDNGQQVIQHGFGVGAAVPGTTYTPAISDSAGAMTFTVKRVADNVEQRLAAADAYLRRRGRSPHAEQLIFSKDFSTLPADIVASGGSWTVSGGYLNGPAGSATTFATFGAGPSSIARRLISVTMHSPSAADVGGLMTNPIAGYGGAKLVVDRPNGLLSLYAFTGTTATFVKSVPFVLSAGAHDLVLQINKDNYAIEMSVVEPSTGLEAAFTINHSRRALSLFALFHGAMGVAIVAGAPTFKPLVAKAPYAANPFIFCGDSIPDGSGLLEPGEDTYANIIARGRNDVLVCGRSGDTSANFALRRNIDVLDRIGTGTLFWGMGHNDGTEAAQAAEVRTMLDAVHARGGKMVLLTLFPNPAAQAVRSAVNAKYRDRSGPYADADGVIDVAASVTVNQDGVTWDTGMSFADRIHPSGYAHAGRIVDRIYRGWPALAS